MPTEPLLPPAAAGDAAVDLFAFDEVTGGLVFVAGFATLADALAAAEPNDRIIVNTAEGTGGDTVVTKDFLFIEAPAGFTARIKLSDDPADDVNYLSLSGAADFYVHGNDLDNNIFGSVGNDLIVGFGGNDFLEGFIGDDRVFGGPGNDTVLGMEGNDQLWGDDGSDEVLGDDGNDTINGGTGDDTLSGGDGRDILKGNGGNDSLDGGRGGDRLLGGAGRDTMDGGAGNDVLTGGKGRDVMRGGDGADRFVFAAGDSATGAARDVIEDFAAGIDKLDLSGIAEGLAFVGDRAFRGNPGEVRYSGGIVSVDIDGDRVADLRIALTDAPAIGDGDLLL